MIVLYKSRKFITLFITGSLLILLFSCDQKISRDRSDEDINNTEENIDIKIKRENQRLTKDKPDDEEEVRTDDRKADKLGTKMEKAARKAGKRIRETSDNLKNMVTKPNTSKN